MGQVTITAAFADEASAQAAVRDLAADGIAALAGEAKGSTATGREAGFMARLAVIVVFWSILGTGAGAALGALLSYTVGPHGTEGLILLIVTWAIFAHVLIGMWAGYVLLSDRSHRELSGVATELTVQADESSTRAIAERLKAAGATDVRAVADTLIEAAASQ